MVDYEIVEESTELDVYRITYGVLVKVFKHKVVKPNPYFRRNKPVLRKFGKKRFIFEEDLVYEDWYGTEVVYKKGTIMFNGDIIEYVTPDKYKFEIKTTGSCFKGDSVKITKLIELAQSIIDMYKEE